ncbi:Uncharacterised protein [Mycobacteroides abscessus subsp. abscessus]|nr:Uncharacterised protein [Mycobacteroides abscessus subsp. abscessus]
MITDEQRAEIRCYVQSLDLGVPSAALQEVVVNIARRYATREDE